MKDERNNDHSTVNAWDVWWEQADFQTMERITGLRQVDFDPQTDTMPSLMPAIAGGTKRTKIRKSKYGKSTPLDLKYHA